MCLSHILQPHTTVSWGCTTGPTNTKPRGLGFQFCVPNRPSPLAHLRFQASQAHKLPLSCILQPHATISWGCTLVSHRCRAQGARFSVSPAKPAHLCISGSRPPRPATGPLYHIPRLPAAVSRGFSPGPTDIAPIRREFWFRLPNRSPLLFTTLYYVSSPVCIYTSTELPAFCILYFYCQQYCIYLLYKNNF